MKRALPILLIIFFPVLATAEVWSWTDSNGVVNYTSDPKNLPDSEKKENALQKPPESRPSSAEKKNRSDDAKKFADETVEKVTMLSLQIENGLKYVDIYHEKERPVSKWVIMSYLNSMLYEISNLKETVNGSALSEDAKKNVAARIVGFNRKYNEYNSAINDFDSIEITNFKSDKQIDYKTTRTVDPNYQAPYNTATSQTVYTSVTEENFVFTFSATISNTGSKADIAVELNGLNYQGTSVKSHAIKTSVGNDTRKDIGDRIILPRGVGLDITSWVIADVKIVRNRK